MIANGLLRISTAAVIVGSCTMTAPARAAVLYSTGFESPTFTAPSFLAGQNGWAVLGTSNPVFVENAIASTGSQSVEINASQVSSQTGPYYALSTSAPIVQQSADIYVTSTLVGLRPSEWQFAAVGAGLVGFAGGINILTDGSIDAITSGFGQIGTFAYDTWNNVSLTLNYSTQKYSVALNGTTLASNLPFCGGNASCTGANVPNYADGIFDVLPVYDSPTDYGFIDNYSVTAVPLPAALPLLASGLGVIGMLARRRKRNGATAALAAV